MVTPSGLVLLTDRRLAARPLTTVVAAAVRGGVSWVIFRERDLRYAERAALAAVLRTLLPAGRLIVAGPDPLGGDAVHLAAADPVPAGVALVGRSCHENPSPPTSSRDRTSPDEPVGSTEDYITLSPIYPTVTKPGYGPALGPRRAAALAGEAPWLALGGVDTAERAAACAEAGSRGIAVMGALMRAADPEATARSLADGFARVAA